MLVLVEKARSAEDAGDFAAAFQAWNQLVSETRRADHYCQLGRVASKLGMWAEAEKAFHDALAIKPHFAVAMLMFGSLLLIRTDGDQTDNAKTAKDWLLRAMEIDRTAMALSLMGAADYRLGEKDAAKDAYRAAIEIDGAYEEAYFNLGNIVAEEGDDAEAERLLRRAIQLDPNYHVAHGRLGILLQRVGRSSEGEAELKRALEINPADAIASRYLNRVAGGLGSTN
jgi:tetratricopeptide (TPR) repeat protein